MTGETTVLSVAVAEQNANPVPRLKRISTGEQIVINKPRFRIGKEHSYVDYFIGNNTAISRSHADIIVKSDGVYVSDMNSTNHTFLNGAMIPSGEEIKMENGDLLKLANEEFEFTIR